MNNTDVAWFWLQSALSLKFHGDIVIDPGVRLLTSHIDISITTPGTLVISDGVAMTSGSSVYILAKSVEVHKAADLSASSEVTFGDADEGHHHICERVSITGDEVRIKARAMTVACRGGLVEITGEGSQVELGIVQGADWPLPMIGLTCYCNSANIGPGVLLLSSQVTIEAETDLLLASADHAKGAEVRGMDLRLKAGDWLHMGAEESEWRVTTLRVAASFVTVQSGHVIKLIDPRMARAWAGAATTRVHNDQEVDNADICPPLLKRIEIMDLADFDSYANDRDQVPLRFDAIIAARSSFDLLPHSRVRAAKLLICSGDKGSLGRGVMLSASCRGHGPGHGRFTGETRQICQSAGGAANFNPGGQGAKFTTKSLDVCSKSSPHYLFYSRPMLPTRTASGGGCGVPPHLCEKMRQDSAHPSAGGGLIWLSVRELKTERKAKIISDGCAGKIMTHESTDYISGGGAGGQIIMFIETVDANGSKLELSAAGGSASCIKSAAAPFVSGGGAGGFVGIRWKGKPGSGKNLDVSIEGGSITDAECDRLVPQEKKERDKSRGLPGKAVSLDKCPEGYVGPFCEPCAVGTWGSTSTCKECRNKPSMRAVYTKEAHNNPNCPYRCVDGVEPEDTNPMCLCPQGYVGETCDPCPIGMFASEEMCWECKNKPPGNRSEYFSSGWASSECPFRCKMLHFGPRCECPAGYGGENCVECPVGTWSEFDNDICWPCENKPSRWAEYTMHTWKTMDCDYRCVDDIPDVSVNPQCDCPAGFAGALCSACPAGQWSENNSMECIPCRNKPGEYSEYTTQAWPNVTCAYRCTSDAFSLTDPKCRGVVQYIADMLLRTDSTFGMLTLVALLLLGFIVAGLTRSSWVRARRRDQRFMYVHDKLPYHLVRVHLFGRNSLHSPWKLVRSVPTLLEDLIAAPVWDKFVADLNRKTKVKRLEVMTERLLRMLHPPLAPFFVLWRRRHRGYAMRELVRAYSEGKSNKDAVWRVLPGLTERRSLQMIFTCDASATLGYVDFFDLSQELCDWKPVDLRREARFIMAHGSGSYLEPFALDVRDPLVEQLAQTSFGAPAIYSMVFTFNRLSRLVTAAELETAADARPQLQVLEAGITECARQCGLEGVARMCLLPQRWPYDSKDQPIGDNVALEASFSDLMDTRFTPGHLSPGIGGGVLGENAEGALRDYRLCLMFADTRNGFAPFVGPVTTVDHGALGHISPPHGHAHAHAHRSGSQARPKRPRYSGGFSRMMSPLSADTEEAPLTVPMPFDVMEEKVVAIPACRPTTGSYSKPSVTSLLGFCQSTLYTCSTQAQPQLVMRALAYLSSLLLLVLDFLLTDMVAQVLSLSSWWYVLLWLSAPPLTPILAIVSGIMFSFWDHWRLARFHAFLVAWSGVNLVVASAFLAMHHSAEQLLTWFPMLLLCKLTLFMCVNIRIVDIEARRDLRRSFTKTPDASSFIHGEAVNWSANFMAAYKRVMAKWRSWRLGRSESDENAERGIDMAEMRKSTRISRSHSDASDCPKFEVPQASPF